MSECGRASLCLCVCVLLPLFIFASQAPEGVVSLGCLCLKVQAGSEVVKILSLCEREREPVRVGERDSARQRELVRETARDSDSSDKRLRQVFSILRNTEPKDIIRHRTVHTDRIDTH